MTLSGFGKYGKRHYLILENWWSLERAFRQQGHFKEFSSLEKCYSPTFIKLATLAPLCLGISRESWAEFGIQREQGRNFKLFRGLCLLVIHDLGKPETVPQSGWQSQHLKALKKNVLNKQSNVLSNFIWTKVACFIYKPSQMSGRKFWWVSWIVQFSG